MQDDEIALSNACTDLVSLKRWEPFLLHLLQSKQPGEWIGVCDCCLQIGASQGPLMPEFFVTWLPDPKANAGYVVILFYDDESKWSMAAHYNRARLLACASPHQPPGGPIAVSSCSPSQTGAPAAEG